MTSMKPVNWAKLSKESQKKITKSCLDYAKRESAHKKVTEEFRKEFSNRFKKGNS